MIKTHLSSWLNGLSRSAVVFVLSSLVHAVVFAEPVGRADAEYAAQRWAVSGAALEKSLGQKVVASETVMATNDVALHVIRFDGGTAFVSSDTELEPIVAFTTSTNFSATAESGLWRLLKRDTIVRHTALQYYKTANLMATASAGFATQMSSATAGSTSKWAKLLEGRNAQTNLRAMGATAPNKLSGVSDVRRAPLVKSQWSQTTAQSQYCYNLYTPNHDPCGCTATAMSQIMRYHEYPTASVTARTYPCTVNGTAKNLTMQGGVYEWSKMTLLPSSTSFVEENWAAIGKLTSDVGIALKSSYSSGAGSSYVSLVAEALKEAFGYANGACIFNWAIAEDALVGDGRVHTQVGLHKLAVREKVIYANLDAKCPVELGVYGYGDEQVGDSDYWEGHAIVGDGYGYSNYNDELVPYVHINLGWHGLDDAWYNIPEIHSPNSGSYIGSKGTAFTILSAAAYNLFPTKTGNIVSGRAYDGDGAPVSGATMTIRATGSSAVIETCTTDEKGIYAFIVPGGAAYDITCKDTERSMTDTHTVTVPKETLECSDEYGVYTEKDANVGNYWGHDADFEMADPSVRLERTGTEYATLDAALLEVEENDVLAIILPTRLKKSVTAAASCRIVPDCATPIVRYQTDAVLTVPENVTVTFEGVSLTNVCAGFSVAGTLALDGVTVSGETADWSIAGKLQLGKTLLPSNQAVTVESTGNLTLQAGVTNLVRVALEGDTKEGLTLAGALENTIAVDAPNLAGEGTVFGTYSCDYATASGTAGRLYNARDPDLGGIALSNTGDLKWAIVTVPVAEAFCVVTNGVGESGYRTFAAAIRAAQSQDGILTVVKDVTHTNAVTLAHDLVLQSKDGATLSFDANAGFVVPAGTHLVLTNITVSGAEPLKGQAFSVTGGELLLAKNAVLQNFETATKGYLGGGAGIVLLDGGVLTMMSGAMIKNCQALGDGWDIGVYGGGIYARKGALRLLGGTVSGCSSSKGGGGIYVWNGDETSVEIANNFSCKNNTTGTQADNLYLASGTYGTLPSVTTALAPTAKIGIGTFEPDDAGAAFVAVTGSLDAQALEQTAGAFACDDNGGETFEDETVFYAACEIADGETNLVWKVRDPETGECDPQDAHDLVVYNYGTSAAVTNYYEWVEDAVTNMTGDCTLVMLEGEEWFMSDLEIKYNVRLMSGSSYGNTYLYRSDECAIRVATGASLTLSNIVVYGSYTYTDYQQEPPAGVTLGGTCTLIDVTGGALTLENGSGVQNACYGENSYAAAGVAVSLGGTFAMESGARIESCWNSEVGDSEVGAVKDVDLGRGGGLLLFSGTAYLKGGTIYNCSAKKGGAIYLANETRAYVSGDFTAVDNWSDDGSDTWSVRNNLEFDGTGRIVLAGEWAGRAGVTRSDVVTGLGTNAFGFVEYAGNISNLVSAATNFYQDANLAVTGRIVTNETTKLLVWSTAIADDGMYTDDDGNRYGLVTADASAPTPEPQPEPEPEPTVTTNYPTAVAFQAIECLSGNTWRLVITNRVPWCRYRLIHTDDLAKGFTETNEWEQADGAASAAWTNDVSTSGGQYFWKAEAIWGIVPEE